VGERNFYSLREKNLGSAKDEKTWINSSSHRAKKHGMRKRKRVNRNAGDDLKEGSPPLNRSKKQGEKKAVRT